MDASGTTASAATRTGERGSAPAGRGRRQGYATGDARRARILNIALQEFGENGYRGTSLARIAERAELTQAGLLHHFRSKQDLLTAVLDLRDEMDAERLDVAAIPDGADPMLRALVALVEHNARQPGIVQLFTVLTGEAVTTDHPAHAWARQRYATLVTSISTALRHGVESGELRADVDPEAVTRQVLAMMDGLQLQWLLDPERVDMVAVFTEYVEALVERIRA
ncbi:TetR/AcrR family transcriptional regulator [Yinghuangia seranimata]|uniref:TetR/AcrR family transcriptional regulator n=1 Tax=Yinghuangia seranimata TaxID=408067 RepID=UPI00248AFBEC|nr:TetR family transcriptional regulator [Yinghuangia seranimata]MDI2127287.1 TetR family transcriptional regulator [Yinghuangia seranimata]